MPPVGFEPGIAVSERRKTYALDPVFEYGDDILVSGWRVNVADRQPFLDAFSHCPVSNQSFCRIASRLTMTVTRNQRLLSPGDRTMVSEFSKQSNTRRHLYPTPFCSSLTYVLHADIAKSQRRLVRLLYFLCRPSLGSPVLSAPHIPVRRPSTRRQAEQRGIIATNWIMLQMKRSGNNTFVTSLD
jgi:hypothetical protein